MEERMWLGIDYQAMLAFLDGNASGRKLRLFAVACCWHYDRLLSDKHHLQAILVAERFADGVTTLRELNQIADGVAPYRAGSGGLISACYYCCHQRLYDGAYPAGFAREVANEMVVAAGDQTGSDADYDAACSELASLLRCLFGNPFAPVQADPAWLTSTVVGLATAIYDSRRFADLPILADALQEAGCDDADVLRHCRDGGEHARGLDLDAVFYRASCGIAATAASTRGGAGWWIWCWARVDLGRAGSVSDRS